MSGDGRISTMDAATTLVGTEGFEILQSGGNSRATVNQLILDRKLITGLYVGGVLESFIDPVTGLPIPGVATYTWADFLDVGFDLTTARHVHISDKHSSSSGYGGSLWYVDPTGTTNNKRLLMSAPLNFSNPSDAPDPALFLGLRITCPSNREYKSNGTNYILISEAVIYCSAVASRTVVVPAATFTAVTADNSGTGGRLRMMSAGVHGLTTGVVVTPGVTDIYVSGGGSWLAGLLPIYSVDDTLTLTLDTTATAPAGTPTISLAGGSIEIPLLAIPVPPLGPDSYIEADATWSFTSSSNARNLTIRLNSTAFFNAAMATAGVIERPSPVIIQNTGSTSVQVSAHQAANSTQTGIGSSVIGSGTVDTSVATTLNIGARPNVHNEFLKLSRIIVKIGN